MGRDNGMVLNKIAIGEVWYTPCFAEKRATLPFLGAERNSNATDDKEANMITDNKPEQDSLPMSSPEGSGNTMKFAAVFVILAALIIGEFYTVHKVNATKTALEAQQAQTRQEISTQLQDQLTSRISTLERNNSEQLAAIRQELEGAAKRMGRTGGELKRARAMVAQLEQQQQQQAEQLKKEIALKADAQQVGAL